MVCRLLLLYYGHTSTDLPICWHCISWVGTNRCWSSQRCSWSTSSSSIRSKTWCFTLTSPLTPSTRCAKNGYCSCSYSFSDVFQLFRNYSFPFALPVYLAAPQLLQDQPVLKSVFSRRLLRLQQLTTCNTHLYYCTIPGARLSIFCLLLMYYVLYPLEICLPFFQTTSPRPDSPLGFNYYKSNRI